MDKPSKLNERLTLIANIAVVLGIIFLALELRQNTNMMRAQIRDSITEKQMDFYGWQATSPELGAVTYALFNEGLNVEDLDPLGSQLWFGFGNAVLREWENSFYQYQRGLFTAPEFEARRQLWRYAITSPTGGPWIELWGDRRMFFAPDFRAEIDAIVAEIEREV